MSQKSGRVTDMGGLIRNAQKLAAENFEKIFKAAGAQALADYLSRMNSEAAPGCRVIQAQDTALELGPPRRESINAVLWTREKETVHDKQVRVIGPDLPELKAGDQDYCQVIMLQIEPGLEPDPFKLDAVQFLPDRLPGLMARMVPGRLWLRISKKAFAQGLNFSLIASALRKAYLELAGVKAVEFIFAASDKKTVMTFAAVASEARILAGRHKRISLGRDGDYECEELDCAGCEDKPVCDIIREVRVIRRRGQNQARD